MNITSFFLKHRILANPLANPRDQKKPRVQHFFFETEDFCCKSKHRSIGGMQLSLKPFFSHLFFSLARKLMKQIELKRRPGNMQRNVKQLQHIESRICSTFVGKSGLGALQRNIRHKWLETSGALETKCSLLGFVLRKKLRPFKEAGRQWETKWETQGDSAVVDGGGILCGEAIRVGEQCQTIQRIVCLLGYGGIK